VAQATAILLKLWRVTRRATARWPRINPLAITPDGRVLALDAKVILGRQRGVPASRMGDLARSRRGRPRPRGWRARRGCPTSSSTATSAASSTAPGWRWRPWTSSSTTAGNPPTFSTSAGRRTPTRSRPRSGSSPGRPPVKPAPEGGSAPSCSTSSRDHALRRRRQRHRAVARDVAALGPARHPADRTNEELARKILSDHGLAATTSMDEGCAPSSPAPRR